MFDKKNVASIASWLNLLLPENKRIYLRGKCRLKTTSPCQGVDQRIFSSLIITQLLLFPQLKCYNNTSYNLEAATVGHQIMFLKGCHKQGLK